MPKASAQNSSGDLNATYFPVYYSLNNLANWMASTGYCLELVVGGVFPDVRYFSVAVNDEHYSIAHHVADADIDPAIAQSNGGTNPFTPDQPNTGSQPYLVPISLGAVPAWPAPVNGCGITPYEEDNLLDATQRHLSIDWNTNTMQPDVPDSGLDPHMVDTAGHQPHTFSNGLSAGPNGAGSLMVRAYLPHYNCKGTQGQPPPNGLACTPDPAVAQPYLFFRDVGTGCPYSLSYIQSTLLNDSAAGGMAPETSAVVSASDPSSMTSGWLSTAQKQDHTNDANLTPQACYADGDPTQLTPPSSGPPAFYNRVPWARAPQWNGQPGPDDSYIGGAISTADLTNILDGSACGGASTQCIIRMRFKLPAMPQTPCNPGSGCELSGSEQLRYFGLTFWQQQPANSGAIGDIDGVDPQTSAVAVSFVSLADLALTATNNYVTLLVNVGPTSSLPSWLKLVNGTGTAQGVAPGVNPYYYYTAWTTSGGYNVLDLNGFTSGLANPFSTSYPLLMTLRENLPAGNFYCSGAAVPFSTAEYIGAGGLLGPYIPLVDYVNPNDQGTDVYALPTTPPTLAQLPLPSGSNCSTGPSLPLTYPGVNAPTATSEIIWPNQSWPNQTGASLPLDCGSSSAGSPQIDFVATQYPTPVDDSTYSGSPTNCTLAFVDNNCSQIIAESLQYTEMAGGATWQPPVQITIKGSGFGFLSGLPTAVQGSAVSPFPYLNVHNDNGSGLHGKWDSNINPNCQVYIANWTDDAISIMANLPVVADPYSSLLPALSPVSDVSPVTFMAASSNDQTGGCPIAVNTSVRPPAPDNLSITVTNPQTGANQVVSVAVAPTNTTLPY